MVGNAEMPQCATWPIVVYTDRLLFQCDTKTENVLLEQSVVRAKTPTRAMPEALGGASVAAKCAVTCPSHSLAPGGAGDDPENEVQRNIRLKVCAYCKTPGAIMKCNGCRQWAYCNKRHQKRDWKTVHREQCEKLQQVFAPPPAWWREANEAAERDAGGAVAGFGVGGDEDEFAHPCSASLGNVDGQDRGMCFVWADVRLVLRSMQ